VHTFPIYPLPLEFSNKIFGYVHVLPNACYRSGQIYAPLMKLTRDVSSKKKMRRFLYIVVCFPSRFHFF
jgi:hypothetical protein